MKWISSRSLHQNTVFFTLLDTNAYAEISSVDGWSDSRAVIEPFDLTFCLQRIIFGLVVGRALTKACTSTVCPDAGQSRRLKGKKKICLHTSEAPTNY